MKSNIETLYDVLVSWCTKFDFIETCTVGIHAKTGMMMITIHCGNLEIDHIITQYEMENMGSEVLESIEHYLFEKLERQFKIQEVGEE